MYFGLHNGIKNGISRKCGVRLVYACTVTFLDMPVCNAGNAASLFELLDGVLESKAIPWCNVVGFESDTANVMIGKHNSVLSRVKAK